MKYVKSITWVEFKCACNPIEYKYCIIIKCFNDLCSPSKCQRWKKLISVEKRHRDEYNRKVNIELRRN